MNNCRKSEEQFGCECIIFYVERGQEWMFMPFMFQVLCSGDVMYAGQALGMIVAGMYSNDCLWYNKWLLSKIK